MTRFPKRVWETVVAHTRKWMRLEGERIQRWRRDLHLQTQVLDIEALFDDEKEGVA